MTKTYINILPTLILLILACQYSFSRDINNNVEEKNSIEMIENAYMIGQITLGDRIFYNLQSVFAPEKLPMEFKSETIRPIRSGTPFINNVLDNWDLLTPDQQVVARAYLDRPSSDTFYISPESRFMIHYDTSGSSAPLSEDLDSNGIPDYVERIGLYSDSSYRHYLFNLEYLPPPSDSDSLYDIYVLNTGHAYGTAVKENPGDSSWDDYGSYIKIHNTMNIALPNQDPEGQVIGALKVTCAHEYYHATQMAYAYKSGADIWWTEGNAVFFEDIVFDIVNDNYSFLPYFFNYPDTFLIDTSSYSSSLHDYSTFIWTSFLAEKFGIDIVRTVWEYLRFYDLLPSIDSALYPFDIDMETVFPEFTVWNYFTDIRFDTAYYEEGANYPLIHIDHRIPSYLFIGDTPVDPPDGFASNYIVTYPDTIEKGLLKLNFDGSNYVKWGFSYIVFSDDTAIVVIGCDVTTSGKTLAGIYDYSQYDSIVFIPCVVSQWQDDNDYLFDTEIRPYGDADGNGEVNIFDVTYIISYLYMYGPAPKYDLLMGDADCNGLVNLFDISYLISHLYMGGPEPCFYQQ